METARTCHGTCIARANAGVLLCGPSGSGKSDLALRLVEDGAHLVADDRVVLWQEGPHVWARPPLGLAGLLEVRGLGIVRLPHRAPVAVRLVVHLGAEATERLPPREEQETVMETSLPLLRLDARQASAPARVRLALGLATGTVRREA